ncbi:alanine racemase [Mangrovimonas spongiae]|uniref:Alanine racemase n=1 Tax=Mangrovimonas spongiae TaxID=2494697 RepID=A0A3R9MGI2_9FLAO|nr:alanine racemase [Mangrovimonas spongiae]RSK41589.1 alanine racemase [Mangrovimonas spongiae]
MIPNNKIRETTLFIDFNALEHNYNYLKSKLQPNTKFLAVVKAFAYGNDAQAVAKKLQDLGVDYFAVAYTSEGVALRDAGITKPILVLHPQSVNFKTIIERCLEPSLYSHFVLDEFIQVATDLNQSNYPIHLKFNTGLNRLGFDMEDVTTIASTLKTSKAVKTASLFSHLAASEDLNEKPFTLSQINNFNNICSTFKNKTGHMPWRHICNTSGILNYPEAHFDMVRSGIGLYGFGNSTKENKHFLPIGSLKTLISQIHTLKPGESLGYNRGFIAQKTTKTATLPIGHADGIGRQYGHGKGYVLINGKKAYIIGNVCMDMIMVDITHIDCQEGDSVILFDKSYTAEDFGQTTETISYEVITSISKRIKRVFIE